MYYLFRMLKIIMKIKDPTNSVGCEMKKNKAPILSSRETN